jgi:signal transduction histidine kinase/CheY-like chemotaxis protein
MSDTTALIRQFFRSKNSDRLSAVVAQVDEIAALLMDLTNADFIGFFYAKRDGERMVPVAYQFGSRIEGGDIAALENAWQRQDLALLTDDSAGACAVDSEPGVDDQKFAASYALRFRCLKTFRMDDDIRGLVTVYWRDDPGTLNDQTRSLIIHLTNVLYGSILIADDMNQVESYSLRLSDLVSLFEMSIGDLSFRQIMSEILQRFRVAVGYAGVCMISEDKLSGKFRMGEYFDSEPPSPSLVNMMLQQVEERRTELRAEGEHRRSAWVDLTSAFRGKFSAVLATPLLPDEEHHFVLVAWTRQAAGFPSHEIELLPVFSLFAEIILQNALLVKSLRKVNYVLRKSSSQMANIESLAALADMTSGVAHDFNNIIGGIIGRLQLMKLRNKDDSVVNELGKLETMAMEGAETVKRLQEFATSARQKDLDAVNLATIAARVTADPKADWQALAKEKGISVDFRCHVDSAIINGSDADLSVALGKLIGNAVEHSRENTSVEVALAADQKKFVVTVTDHGPGIPDDIGRRVFYPFFTTKSERGAGLGLAIVHGIVGRHGGEVSFDTRPGKGTTFRMAFNKSERAEESSNITGKIVIPKRLRVLVVDDDEQIREVLHDMLTIDGHSATTCADAYAALKQLERQKFDIMITDLGMPGMSGLDLAGVVHESHPEMPIAMITGWGTQLDHGETRLKGIRSVLSKPFHLKDVKQLVQDLVAAR